METLLLTLLCAGWRLNWTGRRPPWESATGWDRLPPADRPPLFSSDLGPGLPRLHWLGHSGFLIEWGSTRLLLDPNAADRVNVTRRRMEFPAPAAGWGRIDAALISHAHMDHLVPATLAAVPGLDRILLPAGAEDYLPRRLAAGVAVTGLRAGESTRAGEVEVIAVPARHNGARSHPWSSTRRAIGFVLRRGGISVYCAGDTAFGPHFSGIRAEHRPAAAILPIGAFAPRFPLRLHHLGPEEAVRAARLLGCGLVVPCHFGTFTLSLDFPSTALPRFAAAARRAGQRWAMPAFLRPPATPAVAVTA